MGSSPIGVARNIDLNNLCGDRYTETYTVGASYEGVQTEGDCSANPLGITVIGSCVDDKCHLNSVGRVPYL